MLEIEVAQYSFLNSSKIDVYSTMKDSNCKDDVEAV